MRRRITFNRDAYASTINRDAYAMSGTPPKKPHEFDRGISNRKLKISIQEIH